MDIETLRNYCLSIKGATESLPFDENTLVFKVMDKMFAYLVLLPKDGKFRLCLKCDPDKSILLREQYHGVRETHKTLLWNEIFINDDVPDNIIKELVCHSVEEVIKKLPKKKQDEYRLFLTKRKCSRVSSLRKTDDPSQS
jgi:predicted DNA-binding protein (MmcQ/YjbR family)